MEIGKLLPKYRMVEQKATHWKTPNFQYSLENSCLPTGLLGEGFENTSVNEKRGQVLKNNFKEHFHRAIA